MESNLHKIKELRADGHHSYGCENWYMYLSTISCYGHLDMVYCPRIATHKWILRAVRVPQIEGFQVKKKICSIFPNFVYDVTT